MRRRIHNVFVVERDDGSTSIAFVDAAGGVETFEGEFSTDLEAKLGIAAPWIAGEVVEVGDKRAYQQRIYGCIQAHTTQADWTPDVTPALWGDQGAAAPSPADWVDLLRNVRSQVESASNVSQLRDAVLAVVDTLTGDG